HPVPLKNPLAWSIFTSVASRLRAGHSERAHGHGRRGKGAPWSEGPPGQNLDAEQESVGRGHNRNGARGRVLLRGKGARRGRTTDNYKTQREPSMNTHGSN